LRGFNSGENGEVIFVLNDGGGKRASGDKDLRQGLLEKKRPLPSTGEKEN